MLKKSILIGEADSLDHMSSLPAVLIGEGIKYLSGLNIVIDFGHSVDARKYLEDIGRWAVWFKWLRTGDKEELRFERTVKDNLTSA